MSEDKRRQFRLLDPELSVDKTEAKGGRWVTSGQVLLEVMRGDEFSAGRLAFPFVDAESREDATGQAMRQLELVLEALRRHVGSVKDVP
jgi:hypothetical protein